MGKAQKLSLEAKFHCNENPGILDQLPTFVSRHCAIVGKCDADTIWEARDLFIQGLNAAVAHRWPQFVSSHPKYKAENYVLTPFSKGEKVLH